MDLNTMTVAELIEALSEFDGDLPVVISYAYGDYWDNIVADEIEASGIDEREIEWSERLLAWKLPKNGYVNAGEDHRFALVIGVKP